MFCISHDVEEDHVTGRQIHIKMFNTFSIEEHNVIAHWITTMCKYILIIYSMYFLKKPRQLCNNKLYQFCLSKIQRQREHAEHVSRVTFLLLYKW